MRFSVVFSAAALLAVSLCADGATAAFADVRDAAHSVTNRGLVGVASLAVSKGGRLWATWYTGASRDPDEGNYCVLTSSGDKGETWQEVAVVDPDGPGPVRAFDAQLWMAPDGVLRWSWTQRRGTETTDPSKDEWYVLPIADPDKVPVRLAEPKRLGAGIMMCKPSVLTTGEWAFPLALWQDERSVRLGISTDGLKSVSLRGGVSLPKALRGVDEPVLVERRDGSLWCLIRTAKCFHESFSSDRGKTWSAPVPARIGQQAARLFVRRLRSGNLLLVKHGRSPCAKIGERTDLTAFISKDDGVTWEGGLVLDDRPRVAYPDGQQTADGTIYLIYDRDRRDAREILFATVTEEDVLAGRPVTESCRLRRLVSKSGPSDIVDPAAFGFSPAASPAENVAALQKALDGGHRTVRITKPGVYRLNDTIYIDDETTLDCVKGTVLEKTCGYSHMIANAGLYSCTSNHGITVSGVELRTHSWGKPEPATSVVPGLRGQVAFVRVRDVTIRDFTCVDYGNRDPGGAVNCQYCIQFACFDGVLVENFDIRGGRDGVHFDYGRNFVVRHGKTCTGDDGVALNAGDWPGSVTPLIGSIENGLVEDIEDLPGGKCNFSRAITGVWKDWHPGVRLQRNDLVRVGQNVYCVYPMPLCLPKKDSEAYQVEEFASFVRPTHDRGVWRSPEGINFQFMQADGNVCADIRNVTYRNIRLNAGRSISCSWEVGPYARLIHPEIEPKDYPVLDIRLENVVSTTDCPIITGHASCTVEMDRCSAKGKLVGMTNVSVFRSCRDRTCPTVRDFTVRNCTFAGGKDDFAFNDPHGKVTLRFTGCSGEKPVVKGTSAISIVSE